MHEPIKSPPVESINCPRYEQVYPVCDLGLLGVRQQKMSREPLEILDGYFER